MTQCNQEASTDVSEKTYRRVTVSQDTNPIQLLVLVSATRRMPQTFFNTKKSNYRLLSIPFSATAHSHRFISNYLNSHYRMNTMSAMG